jgi:hypothetical protein
MEENLMVLNLGSITGPNGRNSSGETCGITACRSHPVFIWPTGRSAIPFGSSEDGQVQFEDNLQRSKSVSSYCRMITSLGPGTPGYDHCHLFGMQVYGATTPASFRDQGHLIQDLKQVYELSATLSDGLMPEMLKRLRRHAAELLQIYI